MTLATTTKMFAPAFAAGFNVTAISGTNYVSDPNGIINAAYGDIASLAQAGCAIVPDRPVVTLTSTGGYIVQGAINVIPSTVASTVSYAYTLAAPAMLGLTTTIMQPVASTATSTVTSSGSNLNTATVLTWSSAASVDLLAVGSTLYQIANRGVVASSLVTLSPASS